MKRFCTVGLQDDTVDSSICPPEGGRYMKQSRAAAQVLQTRGIPFLIESCYWQRLRMIFLRHDDARFFLRQAHVAGKLRAQKFNERASTRASVGPQPPEPQKKHQ